MGVEHWSNDNWQGKRKVLEKALPLMPHSVVTDHMLTVMRLNLSFCTDKPATKRLSHFNLPGNKHFVRFSSPKCCMHALFHQRKVNTKICLQGI
jgi:hypothetical protein